MMITVLSCCVIFILIVASIYGRRKHNLPPGPLGLVPFGDFRILFVQNPQTYFDALYKKHGPVCLVNIGRFKVLLVSGWEAIVEAYLNDDMNGRPDICLIRDRFEGENYGILLTDGELWQKQRRFSMYHFRDLGFGRKEHEKFIVEEVENVLGWIESKKDEPFDILEVFTRSALNLTWCLIGGKRLDYSDPDLQRLIENVHKIAHDVKTFGSLATLFPFIRFIFPQWTGYKSITEGSEGIIQFIKKSIDDHSQQDIDQPNDFIGVYLKELKKNIVDKNFSEMQLIGLCQDFLLAGTDTSSALMTFTILFLCYRQDYQQKIYDEIVKNVGLHRLPEISDKPRLVHTQAALFESLRLRSPAVNPAPHRVYKTTKLKDFEIPQNTIIFHNLKSIFMEKAYWDDPETYRPERFIGPDGRICNIERIISFGKGKRICLGENLAKSSSFLTISSIIQKFRFQFDPINPLPSTEGKPGFTMEPPKFKVIATLRQNT